jgi:hypothetical protein
MSECYFCKANIFDETGYKLQAPGGGERLFCSECVDDILEFFKTGKADTAKMSIEGLAECRFGLVRSRSNKLGYKLAEIDKDNKPILVASNFNIEGLDRKHTTMMHNSFGMPYNPSYQQNYPRVCLDGYFLDDIDFRV